MPKKLISAMLMLALLCSSLAIPQEFHLTASADNATYWNDEENNVYKYADFSPFTGGTGKPTGEEGNPYLISNAAQLAALAILVNEYDNSEPEKKVSGNTDINNNSATCSNFQNTFIKLTTDIDLGEHQWVPIGLGDNGSVNESGDKTAPTNVFKGNFDGDNKTLSNMYIGGNPSENGTAANYKYAGLFGYVQTNPGATNVTIQNVNIDENSWVYTSGQFAGGICAYAGNLTIINCCNSANITAQAAAGGIYANANAGNLTIINCCNSGSVRANSATEGYAGGICGVILSKDEGESEIITISNCYNVGSVKSSTNYNGEICGYIFVSGTTTTVNNCYYLNSSTNNGVGVTTGSGSVTHTTTALPAEQMKAAAKTDNSSGFTAITVNNVKYYALVDALNAGADSYNSDSNNTVKALSWAVKKDASGNYGYPEFAYIARLETALGYELDINYGDYEDYNITTFDNINYAYIPIREVNSGKLDLFGLAYEEIDSSDYNEEKKDLTSMLTSNDQLSWVMDPSAETITKNDYIVDANLKIDAFVIKSQYTYKYGSETKTFTDSEDKNHIIEIVDGRTLYVAIYETDKDEGNTEHEVAICIEPKGGTDNFLCWVGNVDNDENLEVLSYRDTYYFYARTDRTIIAVYEKDTIAKSIDALGEMGADSIDVCANIESVDTVKNEAGTTTGFRVVSMCSVPHTQDKDKEKENYIIDWAGILATKDDNIGKSDDNFKEQLTENFGTTKGANSKIMVRGYAANTNNAQYTWTRTFKNSPATDETWYVRAYLVYRENDSEEKKYEYGEIFKITRTDDSGDWTWTSVSEGGLGQ